MKGQSPNKETVVFTIRIPAHIMDRIKDIGEKEDRSVNNVINRAIRSYLIDAI